MARLPKHDQVGAAAGPQHADVVPAQRPRPLPPWPPRPPRRGSCAAPGFKASLYGWELTAFEPPRRAVHSHASGELEADLEVIVEPIADGRTKFTQRMRIRALPALRPPGWLLERTAMKWKMQRDFERIILPNYKRIAERRAAS